MEGQIDNAKNFLNSDKGKQLKDQLFSGENQDNSPSFDAQGNQGAPGQFGQEGQYGAVRGGGLGGALQGQGQGQGQEKQSPYEGMEVGDSTASGGYGRNAQGSSFSRQNQMGTDHDNHANPGGTGAYSDEGHGDGFKTGYSTPGYRKEGEDEEEQAKRLNQNVYGQQADDRGAKGNDYNEAEN